MRSSGHNRFAPRVEPRQQVLQCAIPLVGTGTSLHYSSDRVPGRRAARRINIPLAPARLDHDVEEVELDVAVGAERFTERFAATRRSYVYEWLGDAIDTGSRGASVATVRVGMVHRAIWPRPERIAWREYEVPVGAWDARDTGLGGWSLAPHHHLAPGAVLYQGDGTRRQVIATPANDPGAGLVVHAPDGDLYHFSQDGYHHRTTTAFGGERLRFEPDERRRLSRVMRGPTELCRIERVAAGASVVGEGGARTMLAFDDAGFLRLLEHPGGAAVELEHSGDGLLVGVTDARGNRYRFAYDELGRLSSEEGPDGGGSVLRREATPAGSVVRRSTASGLELVYSTERLAGGVLRREARCCPGTERTVSVVGPAGSRVTTFADGSTLEMRGEGDASSAVGPSATTFRRRTPGGVSGELIVHADQQRTSLTLNGRESIVERDLAARRVQLQTPTGRVAAAAFDEHGALVGLESGAPESVTIERDARGRPTRIARGAFVATVRRDDRGRPTEIDYAGRTVRREFDVADRVVEIVSAAGRRSAFEYDGAGNVTSFTTPAGSTHRYAYDASNRWVTYELPTGERYEATFDADGRPSSVRLPSGREIRHEYDEGGRLRAIMSPEAEVTVSADGAGRVASASRRSIADGAVQDVVIGRDGPVVTSVEWRGAASARIGYAYDADFQVTAIAMPDGQSRSIERDADGVVTALGAFRVVRHADDATTAISDGRLTLTLVLDGSHRLVERVLEIDGREIHRIRIDRDAIDGVRAIVEHIGGRARAVEYAHDPDGQLVEVTADGSARERYEYDAQGNRVRAESPSGRQEARYDASDRLLELDGGPRRPDVDGTATRVRNASLTYGARGELLAAVGDDGTEVRFTYDAYGRMVARTTARGTEEFIYDHTAPYPSLLASRSPGGDLTEYFFDEFGALFAFLRGGAWYYVACDQVGSPRVVVDGAGQPVKDVERDAFGVVLRDSNPDFELCIGFAGGIEDRATGLVRFGRRDYDPQAGRWTGPDPLGFLGDTHLYRYVWNNPVSFRDPSGTQGGGNPIWPRPYQHVSPLDPVFHPEPTPVDDPAFVYDTGPVEWDNPRTDTFPISPPRPTFFDKLRGSEPTPGIDRPTRGWDFWNSPQNYGWRGGCVDAEASVGGLGDPGSPYAPDFPGINLGGTDPAPGDGGVTISIVF